MYKCKWPCKDNGGYTCCYSCDKVCEDRCEENPEHCESGIECTEEEKDENRTIQ